MKNLLKIQLAEIGKELVQTANARELHAFLEVGRDFHTWLARRIEQYGFVEGQDFTPVRGESSGGRPSKEYAISIDMAKELSMVERNDKGKEARQYFIECERIAREAVDQHPSIPQTYAEALQLAADQAKQLEEAQPKIQHYDAVVERDGLINATQVAQKMKMSAVKMNKHLTELGVYNASIKRGRVFKQWFVDDGLGEVKQVTGGYTQTMFTTKGEAWVIDKLISEGVYTP